jgi:exodeoxyribonuclease V alpha subunit
MLTESDLIFLTKKDVEDHIENFERENNIALSDKQKDALYDFAEKKVFIITGPPGTGKTTLLRAIVSLVKKLKLRLTCMTPTGISAKKLAMTIDSDAYTIHRRLGFKGGFWTYNESNQFETDIIIIDESSMIDQEVLYRMLIALRDRVHIIFVGDDNQLPSVGAGNVLREMISCNHIPTVRLDQIFRQNEASDIIRVAHKIKNGDTDLSLFKSDPRSDVFFIREGNPDSIERLIVDLAQRLKGKKAFQIITPRNNGPVSVDSLNTILQKVLNPPAIGLEEMKCYNYILRKGDRIIVRKNDYERGIFNGDIGKVITIGGGFINVEIEGRSIQLTVEEIDQKIKLAYSITVHRSQGLEYPYIIIPFINQHGKNLLQRNLLYTALTRAKEKVIIIGHGSAIEKAIKNSSVSRRNTKLGERIGRCLQLKQSGSLQTSLNQPETSPVVKEETEQSSLEGLVSCLMDLDEKL